MTDESQIVYLLVCLFGRFKRDLYDLRRSIALAELFDIFDLAELQQNLIQLFESDAGRHVADHYLVGAETRTQTIIDGRAKIGRTTCVRRGVDRGALCHRHAEGEGQETATTTKQGAYRKSLSKLLRNDVLLCRRRRRRRYYLMLHRCPAARRTLAFYRRPQERLVSRENIYWNAIHFPTDL